MNDDWIETTLGDCCTITIGRTPPRGDSRYWTQDLTRPFCTIADMNGEMVTPSREGVTELAEAEGKAKRFPAGSLLMSFKLTIGRMGFAACDVFTNEAIAWLDVQDPTLDVRFLSLWLASQDLSTGSGRAVKGNTLNSSSMNAITVPVPPLPVQRRIVDLMAHLDNQIANLRLERDAGRGLRKATLSNLLDATREIPADYDAAFDLAASAQQASPTSEQAMNDDWQVVALEEVVDILDARRRPVNSNERQQRVGDVPYYGATGQAGWIDDSIFDERLVLLGEDAVDFGNPDASKAYVIEGPSWVNNHAHVLRARESAVLTDFLCHSLNVVDYSDYVAFGTRSKLTQGNMRGISLTLPLLPVQRRIVDLMAHLDKQIAGMDVEVSTLESLRRQLLASLLSQGVELPASYDLLLDGVA